MKLRKPPKNPIRERRKRIAKEGFPIKPLDWGKSELKPNKGLKGGSCNRTACQAPGAVYFNFSTEKYYCRRCAEDLNRANRFDAHKMYGHDLCLIIDQEFAND